MAEQPQHNIRAIQELLITGFNVEQLRSLFSFARCEELRPVADEFTPEDGKPVMARKAIDYCQSRLLLDELLAEVREANPRAYEQFEPDLLMPGVEHTHEEEPHRSTPKILTITSPIHLDLVKVPAGEFLMGSVPARDEHARESELPPHRVRVPEFHIGRYPVTNLQYRAFVKATGTRAPGTWESGKIPRGKGNHPVAGFTWYEAVSFCAWLSEETGQPFRLPTEAEWEKAARGTDGRIWPWGDEPPDESRCNFGNYVGEFTSIGRYSPQGDSFYGCADMAGNVWEWCHSLYWRYPYREGDGREEELGTRFRILRGGSFRSEPAWLRCTCRHGNPPHDRYSYSGLRVARGPLEGAP